MEKNTNPNQLYKITKWLAVFGVFLAIYLLYVQFMKPSFQPCSINNTVNCDAITSGVLSYTLGIPTGLYGLIGYLFILYASIKKNKKLLLGMATFGMIFCLRLTILEIFFLHVVCPVCLTCQVVMFLIFVAGILIFRKK